MNRWIVVWSVLLLISIVCADPGPEIPDGRRQKKPLGSNSGSGNTLTKSNSSGQKTSPPANNVKNDEKIPPSVFVQTPPPVQTLHPNIPVPVLPSYGPQGIFMAIGNHGNGQNQFMNGQSPMIMQYISPQGQVQYVQLIRSFMFPYPIAPQYVPAQIPSHQPQLQPDVQDVPSLTSTAPQSFQSVTPGSLLPTPVPYYQTPSSSFPTASSVAPQPSYLQFQPSSQQNTYTNPYTLYASQNRVQLINPPSDLSLNTNEYMPSPANNVYKTIKPLRS